MNVRTARCLAVATLIAAAATARAETPATKPAVDPDVALVRDAILKSMPKVSAEEVTPTVTITDLGGRDISVVILLGDLGQTLGTQIDDDAVARAVNATPSKKMSDLTVRQLADLVKATRAAAK